MHANYLYILSSLICPCSAHNNLYSFWVKVLYCLIFFQAILLFTYLNFPKLETCWDLNLINCSLTSTLFSFLRLISFILNFFVSCVLTVSPKLVQCLKCPYGQLIWWGVTKLPSYVYKLKLAAFVIFAKLIFPDIEITWALEWLVIHLHKFFHLLGVISQKKLTELCV